LLLGIVTTLGNKLLGFLLLFSFGIGLGLPLMIIGTFSSSLAILPRAGIWMIEIKKVFGLILLAMCFYFLNAILSPMLILGGLTGFLLIAGVWYLYDVKNTPSKSWRLAKNLVGMLMVAGSIVMAAYTYKASAMSCSAEESIWLTDYTQAHERARAENKKLFVDIGAPFCTLCAAIDKSLLHHQAVQCALARYITVKIDGSRENDAIVTLKTKYQVLGFPTFLLIDPTDDTLITRWAGELYERSPEDFARELERLA
jgi:thiol:disulfide interchange protein DsbD